MILFENGNQRTNKIALTFDDGPNPYWTPKILDIFDHFNVKGNFFVVGKWVEEYPEVLQDTFNRGHLIGNHSYSHLKGSEDFQKAEDIIHRTISTHTKYIRFPYLNSNIPVFYDPILRNEAIVVGGKVFADDWKNKSNKIFNNVVNNTVNGSIIILHDGSENKFELQNRPSEMYNVLSQIIEHLKRRFDIVRLDEMAS